MSRVTVFPDKFVKGATPSTLYESRTYPVLNLAEALEYQYDRDAHFASYFFPGKDSSPRAKKTLYEGLMAESLCFDIDNPEHAEWEDEEEIFETLAHLQELPGYLGNWTWFYTTLHGYRLIFELDRQVTVHEHEKLLCGMAAQLIKNGVPVDTDTLQWTRLYRLPDVQREDVEGSSEEQWWFVLAPGDEGKPLPPDTLPKGRVKGSIAKPGAAEEILKRVGSTWAMPDPGEYTHLLEADNGSPTVWARATKRQLRGDESFPYLYEHADLHPGSRDTSLVRFIGQVMARTLPVQGTTPHHIFALFEPLLDSLETDAADPYEWHKQAWRKILYVWENEGHRIADEVTKASLQVFDDQEAWKVYQEIHDVELSPLDEDDQTAEGALSRRAVVLSGTRFHFLRPDLSYTARGYPQRLLINGMLRSGTTQFFPVKYTTADGKTVNVQENTILRDAAIVADGHRFSALDGVPTGSAVLKKGHLVQDPFERVECKPHYSESFDEFLHVAFGDQVQAMKTWLALAPAWDEYPVPALSLKGSPGTGKSLLAKILGRLEEGRETAPGSCLYSKWNDQLIRSPFVVAEEGWGSVTKPELQALGENFRSLPTGMQTEVRGKWISACSVEAYFRVVLTANSYESISKITQSVRRQGDRDALNERFLCLEMSEDSRAWLLKNNPDRAGWFPDDSAGEPVEHIMWLYERRHEFASHSHRFSMNFPEYEIKEVASEELEHSGSDMSRSVKVAMLQRLNNGYKADLDQEGLLLGLHKEKVVVCTQPSKLAPFQFQHDLKYKEIASGLREAASEEQVRVFLDSGLGRLTSQARPFRVKVVSARAMLRLAEEDGFTIAAEILQAAIHGHEKTSALRLRSAR